MTTNDRFMKTIAALPALTALLISGALVGRAAADTGMVVFKNFHKYPTSGLWSQELSGTRNGVSMGPPVTSQSCTGVTDPKMVAQFQKLGDASSVSCRTSVISDSERLAEYEQTCPMGNVQRVMRSTMRMVDAKTMTIDTQDDVPGLARTVLHSNVSYLGTCTATAAKPSAAECAELASGTQESAAAEAQCAQLPSASRTQCMTQLAAGRKMLDALQAQCR